jgi:hypothetical protein
MRYRFSRSSEFSRICDRLTFGAWLLATVVLLSTKCRSQDFTHATIVVSSRADRVETNAVLVLAEEAERRTSIRWVTEPGLARVGSTAGTATIVAARRSQVASLLAAGFKSEWLASIARSKTTPSEGFAIRTLIRGRDKILVIGGNDSRGLLFGIGYALRKMELSPGRAALAAPINITSAPQVPLRSHQIGYRFKNNTYDAWTLPMFEQHIRELALFGTNEIQLVAPVSDDRPVSPLYPAPALDTVVGISGILDKYGLECGLYYPEMRNDYGDSASVTAELKDFEDLIRAMPRVDALYVPGGDPGHTPPKMLFPLLEKEAGILRRHHPQAKVWVSAQGFDRAQYEEFYALLDQHPQWLTGVFFGPQSRDSLETQRARIPAQYRLLFYPDIGHTMHAQFPVPEWDPAYALTEGREPIDPRPLDMTHIYRHFASLNTGFVTYSEGVNDDVNKFLWTQLGWSSQADPVETLRDYSRFFMGPRIGDRSSDAFAEALLALERNWRGPLIENSGVDKTLLAFQTLEAGATAGQRNNWRFESALYRAYYDAYVRTRLIAETKQEHRANDLLRLTPAAGSVNTIEAASDALRIPITAPGAELRAHIFDLADRLNRHVRIQLSVEKYGASGIERGANLDRVDVPLNDRVWLAQQFAEIGKLPNEGDRVAQLEALAHWQEPAPGSIYDDLGDPEHEPHLVRGAGFERDPEMYRSAIDGIADKTTEDGWRLSWIDYAESLYEEPLELAYHGLDPHAHYKLRVTYAGEDYTLPLQLVANNTIEIYPARLRKSNPETVEFDLPAEATRKGALDLKWNRPAGVGGGGRGRQVAEVWLIPQSRDALAGAGAP